MGVGFLKRTFRLESFICPLYNIYHVSPLEPHPSITFPKKDNPGPRSEVHVSLYVSLYVSLHCVSRILWSLSLFVSLK